jgi:magnesium transporter
MGTRPSATGSDEPWVEVAAIIAARDATRLRARLDVLAPAEVARVVSRLEPADQSALLTLLDSAEAADLLEEFTEAQAAGLIEELPPDRAAAIVEEMESDDRADLMGELGEADAEAILRAMDPETAQDVRELLRYPPDAAGGLMVTDFVSCRDSQRVSDVVLDLRQNAVRYSDFDVQYVYVTGDDGVLAGVLPLRDLLFASPERPVSELMIASPIRVGVEAPLEELEQLFEAHAFLGVPVTREGRRLVGVVRRAAVEDAARRRTSGLFLKVSGIIGGEELRSAPLAFRAARRLSWLSINIVLNVVAASVIALNQETLERAIVLAVFLPIISDMSGCSGNQAVAVSIRELSLGLLRPTEIGRVLLKEASIGLVNGLVLGALLGGVARLWAGDARLGIVVGAALAANTLLSVCLGGALPLVLKRFRADPALVSGPLLTTATDMCGFLFVLKLAERVLR